MVSPAILERLQAEFDSAPERIQRVAELLATGAPPAYLARYRRGELADFGDDRLQAMADRLHYLSEQAARKDSIRQMAESSGRLTPELEQALQNSWDQDLIDDLYQSLRPRRRTPAMQMVELGLEPLALAIWHRQLGELSLQDAAKEYVAEEKGIHNIENALEGVVLILSERIGMDPRTRSTCRSELARGVLRASAVNPGAGGAARYQQYFEFAEPIHRIGSNRMLELRRAEREGMLKLELTLPENRHREVLAAMHAADLPADSMLRQFFDVVFDHAWTTHLQPACSGDVRRRMKERADRDTLRNYARNLRSQLLAPPLGHKAVLALRTSGKVLWVAAVQEDGSTGVHQTLPIETDEQRAGALTWLAEQLQANKFAAIALPHGRRQAGTEKLLADFRAAHPAVELPMVIPVDEAASAMFAVTPEGRKAPESSGLEVGMRTTLSIGRRLQDPLRELLRMNFRNLGLGRNLDDMHQGMLQRELDGVVAFCVAVVGVDLNRATGFELAHVPGLNAELADAIVAHRKQLGGFRSRTALREVPGMGEDRWRHCVGFLCIEGGDEPLDRTAVHPDDYELARRVAEKRGVPMAEVLGKNLRDMEPNDFVTEQAPRAHVISVLESLMYFGQDPRGELTQAANEGVRTFDDLRQDMELSGRIASLTEFGAFVDLGVGQDGLVHMSQIPGQRLNNPDRMLRVGEVVRVWVMNLDRDKKKIGLSMLRPRHLNEGRPATLGERMTQGRPRRQRREPPAPTQSRAARIPESRRGRDRRPPVTAEGKPDEHRMPAAAQSPGSEGGGERGHGREGRRDGRREGRRDDGPRPDRRGGGGGGSGRVYTIESERQIEETKTSKGEFTSLAGLRALLAKKPDGGGA